jgi:hypothetical protein
MQCKGHRLGSSGSCYAVCCTLCLLEYGFQVVRIVFSVLARDVNFIPARKV